MAQLRIPEGAWVVVCDGAKEIILENIGDAAYPDLRTRTVEEHADPRSRELGTDAPGRAFQSVGAMRSAVDEIDWHDEEERRFLFRLADRLDKAVLSKAAKGLVIVAPPRALGALRKAYTKHIRDALIAEIDKDLVALPVSQIEEHLVGKRRRA